MDGFISIPLLVGRPYNGLIDSVVFLQVFACLNEQIAQPDQGSLVPVSPFDPGYGPEVVEPGILPFRAAAILAYLRQNRG
jgi:hypothetical protein